ncbi:MAG: response regulator transcription factor [Candidatus Sulfotelmatobacter sp.]
MSLRANSREVVFPGRKIRCVLAYDHVVLRQGLRRLLEDEADIEIVGEAGNAAECLRNVYELRPDILVAGTGIFGMAEREATQCVARESSATRVVFVNALEDSSSQEAAADSGVATIERAQCALRQTSAQEFVTMVRNSDGNRGNLEQETMRRAPQRQAGNFLPQDRNLTPREREVLKLLAEGKTVRIAAAILGLSSKTVDAHKFNLMRKLGLHNKAELVMWAIRQKVVKIPVNF